MTTEQSLPPVAKSIFIDCKKCATDRYHTVIAHKSATTAKVKCEVCGSSKTYKLPKAQGSGSTKAKIAKLSGGAAAGATGEGVSTGLTVSATGRKRSTASSRMALHEKEYNDLLASLSAQDKHNYSMKIKFSTNQKIDHPKFGLGIVKSVQPEKVEIIFKDEIRFLVHNRI